MCLNILYSKEKFQKVINHAKKDTLNRKPCLVGYKQFRAELKVNRFTAKKKSYKLCLWNRYYASGVPIKAGWQKKHSIAPLTLTNSFSPLAEGSKEAYSNGFHVYLNKKQCRKLESKTDWCVVVTLPVYFYNNDILVTGSQDISLQSNNGDWVNLVIPTAVLDRYFIKKEDIQHALNSVFNDQNNMDFIKNKYRIYDKAKITISV